MDARRHLRWDRLGPHVVALALVLLVALALSERASGFTTDEGSYAIQAESIRGGSWDIGWPFREFDAAGDHFPYHGGLVTREDEYAYVSHPAWPAALAATSQLGPEEVSLRVLPMSSVVLAAISAFWLAKRMGDGRSAPWAFWIVAGSPLLANGLMLWAHAPAVAVAGLACLSVERVLDRRHLAWAGVLFGSLAVGVLLRSEFLLFAIAVALVVGGTGVALRSMRLVVVSVGCALASYAALRGEAWWIGSIVGDGGGEVSLDSRAGDSASWLSGRVRGLTATVFEGAMNAPAASVVSVLVMVLVVVVVVQPRQLTIPAHVLLWVAVALTAVRVVVGDADPIRGLFAAWPLALLGALALREAKLAERCLLAIAALYAVAVWTTQYDDGGGLQWGARFLSLAIVPLSASAAAGVRVLLTRDGRCRTPIGALLVVGGLLGLVITDQVRSDNADGMAIIASAPSDVVLIANTQIGRLDWREWPERCWLFVDPKGLDEGLDLLDEAGIGQVTYVMFDPAVLRAHGLDPVPLPSSVPIGTVRTGPASCPSRDG